MTTSRSASKPCSTARSAPFSITPTRWRATPAWSTTPATMRRCPTKARPTRWKRTTRSCGTTWRGWDGTHAASLVRRMPYAPPSSSLSTPGTAVRSTAVSILSMLPTSLRSLTHDDSHSPVPLVIDASGRCCDTTAAGQGPASDESKGLSRRLDARMSDHRLAVAIPRHAHKNALRRNRRRAAIGVW